MAEEEEAANVAATVRGLVNTVAADGGLAAVRTASATVAEETKATEETEALSPAEKRPWLDGPGEPGTSQSTASQPDRPIENIRQPAHTPVGYVDVCTDLERTEHDVNLMTADLNRIFGGGNLRDCSLR